MCGINAMLSSSTLTINHKPNTDTLARSQYNYVNHPILTNYFTLRTSSPNCLPAAASSSSTSPKQVSTLALINFNSPLSSSYEYIEYFDRELINTLNKHDEQISKDQEKSKNAKAEINQNETESVASSRPISLLSSNSTDTLVNQMSDHRLDSYIRSVSHASIINEEDQNKTLYEQEVEEEGSSSSTLTRSDDEADMNEEEEQIEEMEYKHKLDNLKFYSDQNVYNNQLLNQQIDSLHRTLEMFLNPSKSVYSAPYQVYGTAQDNYNSNSDNFYIMRKKRDEIESDYYQSNTTGSKKRLFFNFNNNNSLIFNQFAHSSTPQTRSMNELNNDHYQEIVDENTKGQKSSNKKKHSKKNGPGGPEGGSTSFLNRFFSINTLVKKLKFF